MLSSSLPPSPPLHPSRPAPHPAWLPLRVLYAAWAVGVFLLIGIASLPLLLLLPTLRQRRTLVRWIARLALMCMGMRLRPGTTSELPLPCVVVANHESYLDGVVLCAVLPPCFGFVIKREMHTVPGAGWLLTRIGAEFVARNNAHGSKRDALRVLRSASSGQSLAFFPEGTFKREAGLLPFHNGAFIAAVRGAMPVVPMMIRGTRRCLAPASLLPWPGMIEVAALSAISHDLPGGAQALRAAARTALLQRTGLPDLSGPP